MSVFVIFYEYSDKSGSGIVNNFAYEDFNAAHHVAQTLNDEATGKTFKVIELGVVKGSLA